MFSARQFRSLFLSSVSVQTINQSSISATQSGGTNAKSKTNHFDPLGTPVRDSEARDSDHVQVFNGMPQINPATLNGVPQMPVALNGLPSMPETASDTPLPSVDHAKYTTSNATNAWTNHFDPLGTPGPVVCSTIFRH